MIKITMAVSLLILYAYCLLAIAYSVYYFAKGNNIYNEYGGLDLTPNLFRLKNDFPALIVSAFFMFMFGSVIIIGWVFTYPVIFVGLIAWYFHNKNKQRKYEKL